MNNRRKQLWYRDVRMVTRERGEDRWSRNFPLEVDEPRKLFRFSRYRYFIISKIISMFFVHLTSERDVDEDRNKNFVGYVHEFCSDCVSPENLWRQVRKKKLENYNWEKLTWAMLELFKRDPAHRWRLSSILHSQLFQHSQRRLFLLSFFSPLVHLCPSWSLLVTDSRLKK